MGTKDIHNFMKWPYHLTDIHEIWNHLTRVKELLCDTGVDDGTLDKNTGKPVIAKVTEENFMQHLGLKLPLEMKHIYDRLDSTIRKKFNDSKKAIMEALDEDPGEYLSRFNEATKRSNETYSAFCIRLISLYLKGQGESNNYKLTERDQKSLIHGFLQGIDQGHAASLRLVANDTEVKDVQALAKREQKLTRSRGRSLPPVIKQEKISVIIK